MHSHFLLGATYKEDVNCGIQTWVPSLLSSASFTGSALMRLTPKLLPLLDGLRPEPVLLLPESSLQASDFFFASRVDVAWCLIGSIHASALATSTESKAHSTDFIVFLAG